MTAISEAIESAPTLALVISGSGENRAALTTALGPTGLVPILCSSIDEACDHVRRDSVAIVFFDDCLPDSSFDKVICQIEKQRRAVPVIAISRLGEWAKFTKALRLGAFDYLSLPPSREEVDRVLTAALGDGFSSGTKAKAQAGRQD